MASVLIVDDEPGVREVLARWIQASGHATRDAADAEQALDLMAAQAADVAFCDIQMPGHDGLWLTKQLRQRFAHVAVVLATSVTSVPPAVSMQCGVLAYLVKPLGRDAVLRALKTAVAWHDSALAAGPQPEDTGDRLEQWLAALDD